MPGCNGRDMLTFTRCLDTRESGEPLNGRKQMAGASATWCAPGRKARRLLMRIVEAEGASTTMWAPLCRALL